MVRINPPTKLKSIQFLCSPFQGKEWEKEKMRLKKQNALKEEECRKIAQSDNPKRIMLSLKMSAKEALKTVKKFLINS